MPTNIGWIDVAVRLGLTLLASGIIGINRGEHGRSAGLRTTMLVSLAACGAMLFGNLLINTTGKQPGSFAVLDLMRMPMGILEGMGFIGAGAILRRGDLVMGVTTAATMWFVTVMGICFGGGQLGLGLAMFALGVFVLWILKWFERRMEQDHHGVLLLSASAEGPTEAEIRERLAAAGLRVLSWGLRYSAAKKLRRLRCEVQWRGPPTAADLPPVLYQLAHQPGIKELKWRP
jgi:putative Mg2+ transporter-C (MgtC) family protein